MVMQRLLPLMGITLAIAVWTMTPKSLQAADDSDKAVTFSAEQLSFYQKSVKPILVANCIKCHGGQPKIKGGLNMTSRAGLIKGGDTGSAFDAKAPAKSLILQAVGYEDEFLEMPPKGKLDQDAIDVLTKWVEMGLPMPAGGGTHHHHESEDPQINETTRNHWSFKAVKRPQTPSVKNASWVRNPIDAFILARLEAKGIKPNRPVARAALIRRAYYDLIGLPPSPQRVEAFVKNNSPTAYEDLIDELLDMPQYGEKWARHWLDLVHYAESNSFERDNPKPEVWRYRDYIIRSLNSDKPYTQFIREQLAGDELEHVTPDSIIATGYYRLGLWDDESADPPQTRFDELDDWVTVTSQAMLGLTMDCARCHDHKLDPIPQVDYYRFLAFFRDIRSFQHGRDGMGKRFNAGNWHINLSRFISHDKLKQGKDGAIVDEGKLERLNKELAAMEKTIAAKLPGGVRDDFKYESNRVAVVKEHRKLITNRIAKQYLAMWEERQALKTAKQANDIKVLCITADTKPAPTHLMVRGNPYAPGKEVKPGFPQVLGFPDPEIQEPMPGQQSAGRRIVLANWIASEKNPLTARVIVNRIWQHHFGQGIVESTSNFGLQGTKPTHPQLLDWLATEFVNQGWKFKALHRTIMLSNTYRMSSALNQVGYNIDPKNELLWGFRMRRLTAEEIRDSVLAANGTLNGKMYGPSIYPEIPRAVLAGQSRPGANWRTSNEQERARRSIYIHIKRSLIVPMIESFDGADTDNTCPVRFVTTQPTQALGMFNSEFMSKQAEKLANRVTKDAGANPQDQVAKAIELITQRSARSSEIKRGVQLLADLKREDGVNDAQALKFYCLMLYNLNEFIYLD